MIGRRRPLMRAAMIGGAGYAVGKSRAAGQEREADQEARLEQLEQQQTVAQAPPPPPPPAAPPPPPAAPAATAGGDDLVAKINQLSQLHEQGVLDDAQFEAAKQKLLS
jgi:putative oligomerization/nucleic acid binding protein